MENLGSVERKAVEDELSRGREATNQLRQILHESNGDVIDVGDLVSGIMKSFTNTLSVLTRGIELDEVPQMQLGSTHSRTGSNFPRKSDVSDDQGCKSGRGAHKRRRFLLLTSERDTPTEIDDGHAWRKYGQKLILNAKYPRHYYRCSSKFNLGCKAINYGQKIQDDPPLYRTTNYGHHTCRNFQEPETIILMDSNITPADPSDSSILLSSATTNSSNQKHPFFSKRHEQKEKILSVSDDHKTYNQSSSDLISTTKFDTSDSGATMKSTPSLESAQGDVISNLMAGSIDFDDFFSSISNFHGNSWLEIGSSTPSCVSRSEQCG
ncbi:putative WRKY transcription factor [Quillaja saponaria]|uniref:WRKY transcription factor n=1 Tax=Quillaja saponaria TaxID=32244 RepID=A0AAD7LVB8_QUISA|nr:putative WRKY transcription factor [Quillaja saponaria]